MARPQRCRIIRGEPQFVNFSPEGAGGNGVVGLSLDEFEVLRLVDYEKRTHEQCARQMDISRTTVTEIYESARWKVANFLVNGYRLEISGGNYRICDDAAPCGNRGCTCADSTVNMETAISIEKEKGVLRLAVPFAQGQIFEHFGRAEQIRLYDTADGKVVSHILVSMNGIGHGALAAYLRKMQVDVLLCGGIGPGAVQVLGTFGISCCSGLSGDADSAAEAFLQGKLTCNGRSSCREHDCAGKEQGE